jgi:hypothetical protein
MRETAVVVVVILVFALAFAGGWFLLPQQPRVIEVHVVGPVEIVISKAPAPPTP